MSDEHDDNLILKRFGRYLLLDHLVDGGMAKICRARFLSEDVQRIDAIKMVQPQYSKDPAYKTMFLDEIKVSFGLNHPNIAKIHDYGMVDNQLFCAMEYVDGKNLKQILDRLKSKGFVFPIQISVYIISQTCQGLSYAHNFTNKLSGKKSNIIHRDISPHNIMITYEGAVKVIDFGIAKAESNSEATQAGTIKGKMPYLAPEYLEGIDLDHNYDQFAVGLTLWELLCGRKHFSAKNDLAVLKLIQECKIVPPSKINPVVPKELDDIIMKSLQKDRKNRYANMDDFNRALVKFLYSKYPDFNPTDLSRFAKKLFAEEIKSDREKFYKFGQVDITDFLSDMSVNPSGDAGDLSGVSGGGKQGENTKKTLVHKAQNFDFGFTKDKTGRVVCEDKTADAFEIERTNTEAKRDQAKTALAEKEKQQKDGQGSKKVDIREQRKVKKRRKLIKVVASVAIIISLAGVLKDPIVNKAKEYLGLNRQPASKQGVEKVDVNTPEVETQRLFLENLPTFADVYVNGKDYEYEVVGIELEANKEYTVKIVDEDKKPFSKTFFLGSSKPEKVLIPSLKDVVYGELTTSNNYYPGQILKVVVDDEEEEIKLPVRNEPERLPAGSYDAKIYNPEFGTERSIKFKIEEDKRLTLE